ncbi:VWA domain-containing protein [Alkalihalobacterium bogoriense]|uniref:VWA domain-containing protein n=1 Tax=Alkalihalobacterium bogoriense TaxID=246272 RepID=UPI00047D534C|nr:VWA domain-containing protein [Alkalihalobacterium bogoriense]
MGFELDYPLVLLLLIPAIVVIVVFIRSKIQLSNSVKKVIIPLRFLILALLIVSLAIPNIVFTTTSVHTVFLIDRSDSIENSNNEMTAFIREAVAEKKHDDSFAIVSIGKDARVERMLSTDKSFSSNWNVIQTDFTNIEAGIQLGSSLLAKERAGRIVLLSDGNETIGNALEQAKILKEQGISLDVVSFEPNDAKDVALEDFSLPRQVFKGEQANLAISVKSSEETTGLLRISLNNEMIIQDEVDLKEGVNAFRYLYPLEKSGMNRLRAEIIADGDSILENNQLSAITTITGSPKILIVEGQEKTSTPLQEALQSSGLDVDTITPPKLPTELNGYLQYGTIVFNNVSGMKVSEKQMELIEKAVKDFGVGFIMTGGNESFALGGFKNTPIETILPVEMEIKTEEDIPSVGIVYVIDRSGSMMGQRLELAKEAAARSIELLREGDTVGVIAFDDRTWQIVDTEPMTNIKEVTDNVLGITAGGGTDIYPGLHEAYMQIQELDLQRKHIILLTDGESPETGNYQQLIETGRDDHNVTLSTIAVGDGADHFLLDTLAEYGTGRFYAVYDETTIPSVLSRETMLTTRTYIEDNPFYPMVVSGNEWTTHFTKGVPQMNAYIATTSKDRASVVLSSEKEDPVLVRWQYGLGKTVAWTSDVKGEWSGQWAAWEQWAPLWNDIITWTIGANQQEPFDMTQKREGTKSVVTFSTEEEQARPLDANVVNESGQEVETTVRMTAPGQYEVSFEAIEGMHYVQLVEKDEESTPVFQTGLTIPYPEEYKMLPTNETLLQSLAKVGEGAAITNGKDAFRELNTRPVSKQSISHYFILLAFFLFFIEVAIRRFGLPSFVVSKGKKTNPTVTVDPYVPIRPTTKRLSSNGKQQSNDATQKDSTIPKRKEEVVTKKQRVEPSLPASSDTMKRLLEAKNRKRR